MILLETIDDLLKELLPAAVPQEGIETEEELTVYQVTGERIHFGEIVAYSSLQLLVRPGEGSAVPHLLVRHGIGTATIRGVGEGSFVRGPRTGKGYVGEFWSVIRSRHRAMVMSFDQAIAAAIRHLDSAAYIRNEKVGGCVIAMARHRHSRKQEKPIMNWPSLTASL